MGKQWTVSEVKAGANVDWYEDTVVPDPVEDYRPEAEDINFPDDGPIQVSRP